MRAEQDGTWTGKPLRAFNWWFGDAFLLIVLYFVFGIGAFIAVGGSGDPKGWAIIAVQVIPWIAFIGWPVLLTKLAGNGPSIDLGLRWSLRDIAWGLMYGFVSIVVALIIGYITELIAGISTRLLVKSGRAQVESCGLGRVCRLRCDWGADRRRDRVSGPHLHEPREIQDVADLDGHLVGRDLCVLPRRSGAVPVVVRNWPGVRPRSVAYGQRDDDHRRPHGQ